MLNTLSLIIMTYKQRKVHFDLEILSLEWWSFPLFNVAVSANFENLQNLTSKFNPVACETRHQIARKAGLIIWKLNVCSHF